MKEILRPVFDEWVNQASDRVRSKQWLLSKWEVMDGVEWSQEKIDSLLMSIRDGLDLQVEDALIDLGCGGGWILKGLQPYAGYGVGLDFSLPMLQQAKPLFVSEYPLISGAIGELPFKAESFEKVLCYFVFTNFTDDAFVEKAVLDIYRLVKPGGRSLIGQLPDKSMSPVYDQEKARYFAYLKEHCDVGQSTRDVCQVAQKLFVRQDFEQMLKRLNLPYESVPSFNPFYRPGEPERIDWRFDIILRK